MVGRYVTARPVGWDSPWQDGDLDDAPDHVVAGTPDTVTGYLTLHWVETLGYWQVNVAGVSVDPATITDAVTPEG
jgi:hypothetical protein